MLLGGCASPEPAENDPFARLNEVRVSPPPRRFLELEGQRRGSPRVESSLPPNTEGAPPTTARAETTPTPAETATRESDPIAISLSDDTARDDEGDPPVRMSEIEIESLVGEYLDRLRSRDAEDANAAYRELWEVSPQLIPRLLREVDSDEPTSIRDLRILVFAPVVHADDEGEVSYDIPGMRGVMIDDVAAGLAPNRRGSDVRLRRRRGFPLGAVVRAALLNRFRSPQYPPGDDSRDPRGWWRAYYEAVKRRG